MAPEVGTPEWWLQRLDKARCDRAPDLRRYNDYYEGNHPLLFATEKYRKAFGQMFRPLSDNWCETVVDAVEERLNIEGFRIGDETKADTDAWDIWQRNQLDAESQMAHTEALITAESAVIVWWDPDETSKALITVERADQVIVEREPVGRNRRAALKRWDDEEQKLRFATVYRPEAIWKWQAPYNPSLSTYDPARVRWEPREVPDETWPLKNKLGVVPVVPLTNRPRIGRPGRSEIANVIPKQDAVNKLFGDMILASEYGSFRQRWATGIEIPEDPETHQPIEPFQVALDRVWLTDNDNARFGDFAQTDLEQFVKAIELVVQHIASQSRTPPHYFYLSGQFPSGEAIKSAETGLVAKTRRKTRFFGEAWEEIMRLALKVEGKSGADSVKLETVWGDPESRSEAEHVDATIKLKALNLPDEFLWEYVGLTPTQIEQVKQLRAEELARQPAPVSPVALSVQPAKVETPVTVNVPPRPPTTKRLMRDAAGNVLGSAESYTDGQKVPAGG